MKLGMGSWSEVQQTPVALFPGDEAIDAQTHQRLARGGYSAIVAYITAGTRPAGVVLDSITEERWRRLTFASYYIDEYIDSSDNPEQAHHYYDMGLSAALGDEDLQKLADSMPAMQTANTLLLPSIIALKNSIAGTSTKQREQLRSAALTISDVALEKASTHSVDRYIEILGAESDAMVDLYDHSATGSVTGQPSYARFSQNLHDVMRVAVYGDSTLDLRSDYEQGVTQVAPTPHAIGKLALQTVAPAWRASRQPATWHMLRQVKLRIVSTNKEIDR